MDGKIYSEKMLNNLRERLEKQAFKYITYPKFIFLCGKGFSGDREYCETNRGILQEYIKKASPDVCIVLSEQLWDPAFGASIDLLTFEEFLAEVSDSIILFPESPGSYCELGAFAYATTLFSEKLTIVLDEQYRGGTSFLLDGPVAKAKKAGSSIVYAPLNAEGALLSSKELRAAIHELISKFSSKSALINKCCPNEDESRIQIKSFIVEILELIRITQPVERSDLIQLYKKIKGFSSFKIVKSDGAPYHSEVEIGYIYKLLESVKIIQTEEQFGKEYFTLINHENTQSLMFKYYGQAELRERNKALCRKYKWGAKV